MVSIVEAPFDTEKLGGSSRSLSMRGWEPYEVDAIAVGAMLPSSETSCVCVT